MHVGIFSSAHLVPWICNLKVATFLPLFILKYRHYLTYVRVKTRKSSCKSDVTRAGKPRWRLHMETTWKLSCRDHMETNMQRPRENYHAKTMWKLSCRDHVRESVTTADRLAEMAALDSSNTLPTILRRATQKQNSEFKELFTSVQVYLIGL